MKGIKIERVFSATGAAVREQVRWKVVESRINGELRSVEVPETWSENSVSILVSKYFRKAGVPSVTARIDEGREDPAPMWLQPSVPANGATFGPETSAHQVFHRMAGCWTYWGWRMGALAREPDVRAFYDEVYLTLARQAAAPNSPQWFNTGLHWAYGIEGSASGQWAVDLDRTVNGAAEPTVRETQNAYERPQPHACFIVPVADDLVNPGGILDLVTREVRLFKQGSGAGTNFSTVRGRGEPLSNGGVSSGLMSFLKIGDQAAGSIKSGGTCLAPTQRVYTEVGPVEIQELARRGETFVCLSYDPPAGRFKAKRGRAWLAGEKSLVRVVTDKGVFELSNDHPVLLNGDLVVRAGELVEGQSIFACSVEGSKRPRVHLRNGKKEKELLHRLIAADVLGWDLSNSQVVHHIDENPWNNHPDNFELLRGQSEHARRHNLEVVARGEHVFQRRRFDRAGESNGMHTSAPFWQDPDRVQRYRARKRDEIRPRASKMQEIAGSQRMLNTVCRVKNLGGDVSTLDSYIMSREKLIGKMPSRSSVRRAITRRFGSWDSVLERIDEVNHRVISVEPLGKSSVYDVEVDCPTADDKTPASGHNFVIWPNAERTGRGIVVFNTRRAAKMVIVDADHPEIEEFVNLKAEEEYKAAAMYVGSQVLRNYRSGVLPEGVAIPNQMTDRIDNGFDSPLIGLEFEGPAFTTITGQNANNSVRLNGRFLDAVADDADWRLTARTTGETVKTVQARSLWNRICRAAWASGDPGLQFDDVINDWHTCPEDGRINGSNPCSEYMFLDDTACNLASLNLAAFKRDDGAIDVEAFRHAVRLWTVVLDVSVEMASFPSREIAVGTWRYRTLGLGYANLGGLLMRLGLPYDSDEGRALAAALTALMTGTAYEASAELASALGPFPRWEANEAAMRRVLRNHARACGAVGGAYEKLTIEPPPYRFDLVPSVLHSAVERSWRAVLEAPAFRNAQVSVLAPTGTISFVMDCDTTGVEPDLALLKVKKLAGGETMTIANGAVHEALARLGYANETFARILRWIEKRGTPEGCPDLNPEHLAIFDCANRAPTGSRSLSADAHLQMVAAVQPFVSGGVSKTVNLPESATVEDVSRAYLRARDLGLKSVALYRESSKLDQPLSVAGSGAKNAASAPNRPARPSAAVVDFAAPSAVEGALARGEREHLPWRRTGETQKVKIGPHAQTVFLTVNRYPDGRPGEIFVELAGEGSTLRAMANLWAIAVSVGLQFGVPVEEYVERFVHTKFEPAGLVEGHDRIKIVSSIADLVGRELAITFLGAEDLADVALAEPIGDDRIVAFDRGAPAPRAVPIDKRALALALGYTGDACQRCGAATMKRTGACQACDTCGETTGCG